MGRGVAIRRTVPPYQHHEGLFLYSLFLFADPNIAVEVICSSLINNWHLPTLPGLIQVPSAVRGLTALFEMGRGVHPPYQHHEGVY
jgi:hypothetical protein